jgi:hypothetical protein
MNDKLFHLIAGTIFALVALLHVLRIYMGWSVVVGGWSAPMWVSWIGLVVARLGLLRLNSQKSQITASGPL